MYRNLFTNNRKINRRNLILLAIFLVLVMVGGYFYLHQDARTGTIDKIKDYFSDVRLRAHIGEEELKESQPTSVSDQMSPETEDQDTSEKLTEEALSLGKTKEILGQETETILPEKKKLTLEEIAEQVNEISKKVVLVSIQVQILSLEDISSQIDKEEDIGEDTLEQISERIDQVSEKIESISAQLEQLSSEQTY